MPSPILSEDFSDIIFRNQTSPESLLPELETYGTERVNAQYTILHAPLSLQLSSVEALGYTAVPKLFTFLDTVSLEKSGITAVQIQPFLDLSGQGVLIGFLDSGIDYMHPAFRRLDGRTRILRIWDQTEQSGTAPYDLGYGSEYREDTINEALFSADPRSVVPTDDPSGHGTAVAGIACGSMDETEDFTGAAPEASIVFVKLKSAKQYLRDYFIIPEDAAACQETDLMLGVRYLLQVSKELRMPLVICLSLGTNQGGHTGTSPLEEVLAAAQFNTGVYVVTGTGNEVGRGHHYLGRLSQSGGITDVELLIDQETEGFSLEFWANTPELYSIGFTSPLGETIQPIQPRREASIESGFLLEASRVTLTYSIVDPLSGSQLALMRFQNPTPGIWRIRVVNKTFINGIFHMWLPITNLVDETIRFFTPDSNTTLVIPSCTPSLITVSTYNAYNNSLYIYSGRGYTRSNIVKPDFAAPGVALTAPARIPDQRSRSIIPLSDSAAQRSDTESEQTLRQSPGIFAASGLYTQLSGSCAAAALSAGAAALLVQAGLRQNPPRYFTASEIKSLFLRGAQRTSDNLYPNREWGYGTMDIYGIFDSFLRS